MDDGGTDRTGQSTAGVTDRRRRQRRRSADALGTLAVRGLLHDLGHELTTLSYLVEAVNGDVARSVDPGARMTLVSAQLARLLDIITNALAGETGGSAEARGLASQVARLASAAYGTSVQVAPGPAVPVQVNPTLLWRVLSNLVDNAARAAGPKGHVEVAIKQEAHTVIDVIDDGPGFGNGPPGTASLGLRVTASLLERTGGRLDVQPPPPLGGTRVRVVLPGQGTRAVAGRRERERQ